MPSFKKVQQSLCYAYSEEILDDEEFLMLYDAYQPKNPDYPYDLFGDFDLDTYNEDQCETEFRFQKSDIFELPAILDMPEEITCYNNVKIDAVEALCINLKRFAYPCRYFDMIPIFGRPIPQLSIASNHVMDMIFDRWGHLLRDFQQPWLAPDKLVEFCNAIHDSGAPLSNCFGFVDGTVRPICRPGEHQRVMYNGHKRVHAIKFQSVATPNGLIANLFGPVEGKRHNSAMLRMSNLLPELQQHALNPNGDILCIYGDPAYPHRPQLQCAFKSAQLTADEDRWNQSMNAARTAVEWVFGDVVNYFKFLDFKKNLKIGLSPVGKMYIFCALLHNARMCLYGSNTSEYFDISPPSLDSYFQ